MSDERNIAQRHRFGPDRTEPVSLRDLFRSVDWLVVSLIVGVAGFWCWVGYSIAQWWPK